ncbi:MAG: hypothetical protein NC206_06205, partial [Bacteroides sp.]|nr:hypothetical protein [Roseburia sp.]MCM1346660.1 hypothetical protein [Bacteroides sp.]MCM1419910.1 hypothetical protein [Bacteroides sp.]
MPAIHKKQFGGSANTTERLSKITSTQLKSQNRNEVYKNYTMVYKNHTEFLRILCARNLFPLHLFFLSTALNAKISTTAFSCGLFSRQKNVLIMFFSFRFSLFFLPLTTRKLSKYGVKTDNCQ